MRTRLWAPPSQPQGPPPGWRSGRTRALLPPAFNLPAFNLPTSTAPPARGAGKVTRLRAWGTDAPCRAAPCPPAAPPPTPRGRGISPGPEASADSGRRALGPLGPHVLFCCRQLPCDTPDPGQLEGPGSRPLRGLLPRVSRTCVTTWEVAASPGFAGQERAPRPGRTACGGAGTRRVRAAGDRATAPDTARPSQGRGPAGGAHSGHGRAVPPHTLTVAPRGGAGSGVRAVTAGSTGVSFRTSVLTALASGSHGAWGSVQVSGLLRVSSGSRGSSESFFSMTSGWKSRDAKKDGERGRLEAWKEDDGRGDRETGENGLNLGLRRFPGLGSLR